METTKVVWTFKLLFLNFLSEELGTKLRIQLLLFQYLWMTFKIFTKEWHLDYYKFPHLIDTYKAWK